MTSLKVGISLNCAPAQFSRDSLGGWHTPPNTWINSLFENEELLTLAAGDVRRGGTTCHCEQQ
jgi:hypothetical protein